MGRFVHWSTESVKINKTYKDINYTAKEWELRKDFEHRGSDMWEKSVYEADLSKLEI